MSSEAIVTIPPDVVRTLASSTVFVKASSRVNLDLAGMVIEGGLRAAVQAGRGGRANLAAVGARGIFKDTYIQRESKNTWRDAEDQERRRAEKRRRRNGSSTQQERGRESTALTTLQVFIPRVLFLRPAFHTELRRPRTVHSPYLHAMRELNGAAFY